MEFETKKVTCPHCQKQQNIVVYPSINITLNPEIKDDVISASIFTKLCKYCGGSFEIRHPVLYNDMERRFLVYYIPDIDSSRIIDTALEEDYDSLKYVKRRIVPDYDTFREKIHILESGLDDMAIEITKLAVLNVVKKKEDCEIIKGTFSFCYQEKNTIGFEFETSNGPYCQSTRMEVYHKAEYIVRKTAGLDSSMTGFLKIDSNWAENMLHRFKVREEKRRQYLEQEKENTDPIEIALSIDSEIMNEAQTDRSKTNG
ncbi:MAG: CpXC domain-containing protein [Clostridiales bacterium]|nr:CpXC domain-containing protein [Clostridiales bacterium]